MIQTPDTLWVGNLGSLFVLSSSTEGPSASPFTKVHETSLCSYQNPPFSEADSNEAIKRELISNTRFQKQTEKQDKFLENKNPIFQKLINGVCLEPL